MSGRDVRILFVGDMHLGRLPSRVPGADADLPPLAELGPGAAWLRVADEAERLEVDAVALAGDVLHGANDLFEGAGELDAGLQRLERAGIVTVAVAGNHDTRVLPQLADRRRFQLLGPGGTWSEHVIRRENAAAVRLVGWSFPSPQWNASPLATPPPPPRDDMITLGLLHADLDQSGSVYAPVARSSLAEVGYDGWFLGHIHRPDPEPHDTSPFYLGSLTGLDPTETGVHGPVLVTVAGDGSLTRRRLPLAPLRWQHVDLPVGRIDDPPAELAGVVHGALEDLAVGLADELADTRVLGVRIRMTGGVADPPAFADAATRLAERTPRLTVAGTVVFVEKLTSAIEARRDLAAVARQDDPAGLLARRIMVLDGAAEVPGVDDATGLRRRLLKAARTRLARVDRAEEFHRVAAAPDDETVGRIAAATARDLLERLLTARGERRAAEQD